RILPGVVGGDVLWIYLAAGVPVALATDDEGGIRSNLTEQFARAVVGYHLGYDRIKTKVPDGLEHAFLPGDALWAAPEAFGSRVRACAGSALREVPAEPACRAFLAR